MQLNREIFFDGACLPINPNGIACWGVVAKENDKTVCERSGIISRRGTNNIAEWSALIEAIKLAKELGWNNVTIFGDSLLVVNQFNDLWRVRRKHLKEFYLKAKSEAKGLKIKVEWISREENIADSVCHKAFIEDVESRIKEEAERQFQDYSVTQKGDVYIVTKNDKSYQVTFNPLSCSCSAFQKRNKYPLLKRSNIVLKCKHHFIVEFWKSKKVIPQNNVALETSDQLLHCPCCGCKFLHFSTIEMFNREREDSDKGLYCIIKENSAILKTKIPETNPSSRRNGIRIKLWCENCRKKLFFEIFEHEGYIVLDQEILEEKDNV